MQKTHQSALQVQQKAEALLQANHYDMDLIRDCAESVASHWQQLMLKMEDRLKLVNASVAFYKTSEQVTYCPLAGKGSRTSLSSLSKSVNTFCVIFNRLFAYFVY